MISRLGLQFVLSLVVALAAAMPAVAQKQAIGPEKPASLPIADQLRERFASTLEIRFDQPYAGNDNRFQQIDLYLPKSRVTDQPLPAMVYIHGGGWSGGDRKGFGGLAAARAASGKYVAASVGYRLSGEAKWPAQIHDCKAAIRWLRGHAKDLNIDPDKIGVQGTSAGGHLVSLLGLTAGLKELEGDVGEFTSLGSQVTCVVDVCGPTDFTLPLMQGEAAKKDDPAVAALIGGSPKEKHDLAVAASPMTYVTKHAAPFLIVHGSDDLRVNYAQSAKLDAALKQAGASSILLQVIGAGHGIPNSPALTQRVDAFLDLHMRGVAAEISSEPIAAPQPAPSPAKS